MSNIYSTTEDSLRGLGSVVERWRARTARMSRTGISVVPFLVAFAIAQASGTGVDKFCSGQALRRIAPEAAAQLGVE